MMKLWKLIDSLDDVGWSKVKVEVEVYCDEFGCYEIKPEQIEVEHL